MLQLICHLIGDYILQSDWMAQSKTTNSFAALCHALTYGLPFVFLNPSWLALLVIVATHFLIDRFRLARYLCYAKNFLAPRNAVMSKWHASDGTFHDENAPYHYEIAAKYRWENCKATGYPSETPVWLSTWLLIIADNTLHLSINYLALRFL